MKYFLIAGEASGDLHGAHLIEALKQQDPHAEFVGLGGELMQGQGMNDGIHGICRCSASFARSVKKHAQHQESISRRKTRRSDTD